MIAEEFVTRFRLSLTGASQTARELSDIAAKGQDAAAGLAAVEETAKDAGDEIGDLTVGMTRAQRALKDTASRFRDVGEAAEKARHRFADFGSSVASASSKLAGGTIAALRSGAAGIFETTGGIERLHAQASAAGLTTQEFQRLSVVAEKNGANMERLGMGLRALNARMVQVRADGTDTLSVALKKIGVTAEQLSGTNGQGKLGLIADGLKHIKNDAERAATAALILGEEAGPGLSNLLAIGSKGIDETAGAVKTLTDEQIAQAEALNAKWVDFQGEMMAKARELALALAPVVSDGLNRISDWFARNADTVQSAIAGIVKVASFLVEHFEKLVAIFAAGKLATGMSAIGAAATQMGFAFGTALGPIGAIAAALVALIPIAYSAGEALGDALAESSWADKLYGFTEERAATRGLTGAAKIKGDAIRAAEAQLAAFQSAAQIGGAGSPLAVAEAATEAPVAGRRGSGRRAVARTSTPEPTSSVTFADVISAVRSGRGSEIARNIQGLAASTPRAESIKPTVAITYYHFEVEQNIAGAGDPGAVAAGAAGALKQAFGLETARIAQSLAGGIVR